MGTHPIFESDFDCLTECQPETLKSEKLPQTLTAKPWSTVNLKISNSAITRENMLSYFSTPWISLLSARQNHRFLRSRFNLCQEQLPSYCCFYRFCVFSSR